MTILEAVNVELATQRYADWAAKHPIDDNKVHLELAAKRRPTSGDSYARCIIEAIRVGLATQPPPPPPPVQLIEVARHVMFTAWAPQAALQTPSTWKVAVSADPSFDTAVRAAAPALKARGPLAVWGVQTQIGAQRIRDLAADLDADLTIMQAEDNNEYDTAVAAGAQIVVGNPNNWDAARRTDATNRCNANQLAVMFEVYSNMGSPWPDTASSQGVPVACEVFGIGWGTSPYQLPDYQAHTPPGVWATMSVYLAENMGAQSWPLVA